ncbi:RagB/SusD family nutrient uptake outer membrane protein [Bacteroides thetaiotaomicron]|uniref:SusD family n=1 Tax=Bacteroides thetaiotaomicron TaxID=818 RepID=A0A174P9D6_BACT4|nr:RagB/SusD family nutrient uptake outer membrane protein [Bacteroides thetaiotaomicron]CUP55328.1 SusD family [Bacteroides thetaiotaomicron]
MKLYKIKYAFIVAVGLMLHSCLDLEPKDQLAETNIWSTPSDFELFANQFYGWSRNFSVVDNHSTKPLHSDYNSDLMTYKDDRNRFSNGSNAVQESDGNYGDAYAHIRRTNLLLKNAEDYSNQADIAQFVGEAKFFRAYSYFELVQLYGNAIIVTKPLNVTDPELKVAQNDRSEVIDFIIKDLEDAALLLPKYAEVENGRISQEGCWAFLSRVALYEGTWQKFRDNVERGKSLLDIAAKAAKEVIDSKQFSMFNPEALGDSAQKYMFILEDTKSNPAGLKKDANKEYIFSRRYDEILNPIGKNITKGNLINVVWITRKFANMYLCQDGLPIDKSPLFKGYDKMDSEFMNRDNRMRYTMARPHDNFWSNSNPRVTWNGDAADLASASIKNFIPNAGTGYHNQKWAAERAVRDNYEGYDFPVIRYAEILLNYAEAVFERDDRISDSDLNISLNLVRCRVNKKMPKLSNEFVSINSLDLRIEIRRERTIELFHEGFRLDDLKRWKTAETEMPQDLLGIKWKGTEYETAWPKCQYTRNADGILVLETGRKWAEKNYLFPLPKDQLQLNPNLKQNRGWE